MSKRLDKIRDATDNLVNYTNTQVKESENILAHGYATLMGWEGPRRCFITMTNDRLIILWLKKKYDMVQTMQDISLPEIAAFFYMYDIGALFLPRTLYYWKLFTPQLYIEQIGKKRLEFAFDNRATAKAILEGLKSRLPSFRM